MRLSLTIPSEFKPLIEVGQARATYDRYGDIRRLYLNVTHRELSLFKEISAVDEYQLQLKLDELLAIWDRKYQSHIKKVEATQTLEEGSSLAQRIMSDAEARRHEINTILTHTLAVDDTVDWSPLKSTEKWQSKKFPKQRPKEPEYPSLRPFKAKRYAPPRISLIDWMFLRGERIRKRHRLEFDQLQERRKAEFIKSKASTEKKVEEWKSEHEVKLAGWKQEQRQWEKNQKKAKDEFEAAREHHNQKIDQLEAQWRQGVADAVVQHTELVLGASIYPEWMERGYTIQYDECEKLLKLEYDLPKPDKVKLVKSARFVRSTGEVTENLISESEQKKLYDSLCYQIALRSVHELFEADEPRNIGSVAFNGVVDFVDGATGKQTRATIISAIFERDRFEELNLSAVDPKACFKSFKGVAAASLIGITPVSPLIKMDKEDKRFIAAQDTELEELESTNLASMDWEEFEHLVRAIFEKEFAVEGGEVKVTQASSDGGVDAIAFDPDPIRGGKIVIQAKRYTKTVGVAAVRELFGTVVNEGATKGILVTTADYGADAYKFASDKPITLLNGGNLLYLLQKHGFKGRIDIKAARKEMGLC